MIDFLDPQTLSHDALAEWVERKVTTMNQLSYTPELLATFKPYELTTAIDHSLGAEGSIEWRKFFLATLVSDWACYTTPVDRADYARLKYIMTSAYRYFRVWCCRNADGELLPVGYSGWYPIAPFVFNSLRGDPSQIDDLGVFMPLRFARPEDTSYAYAFNISIIEPLKNTLCAQRMIRAYKRDGQKAGQNIAAITVSPEGTKFSNLGQLRAAGVVTVQGESETLFLSHA
jgi:hypothetical protein